MFKSSLIFIISFFISSKLHSQTSDDELLNIVVTPSGFEQKIKNTNSFIKVISKKDIEKSSANNLVDLLQIESSIGIASTGGTGSIPSYFLRGFPKKYLKVTVDGMNIADHTTTQAETYLQNISFTSICKRFWKLSLDAKIFYGITIQFNGLAIKSETLDIYRHS